LAVSIAKGPVPSFLIFRRDYFEESRGKLESRMNFGFERMIQGWFPKLRAAIDKQIRNSSAETRSASESSGCGQHSGSLSYFHDTGEFLALWPSSQLGWSRQIGRDVHSRASELKSRNALARFPSGVI